MAVAGLIAEDTRTALRERGLTQTRATALWEIGHYGPITQRGLADHLRVTPRNVTTLVDALAEAGLVTRVSHFRDRRAILVDLTETGRAAVTRMDDEATALADELFGSLSSSDRILVLAVFERIAAHFARESSTITNGDQDE